MTSHCHIVLHDGVLAANRYTTRGRALLCGDMYVFSRHNLPFITIHCLTATLLLLSSYHPSINVKCGEHELADLDLGMHAISRVWCARCQSPLGLKILRVPSTTLESTAGKYLLDCCALVRQGG